MCNKWFGAIMAIVLFLVVVWPNIIGATVSMWVAAIIAVLMFLHAFMCKSCGTCASGVEAMPMKKPAKKGKKK